MRRSNLAAAQKKVKECNAKNRNIPHWAKHPKDYNIWKNGEYGEVEKIYRMIAEYVFVRKNGIGNKASKYLPSNLFMLGFRRLESEYLKKDKLPRDLLKYIILRIIAIYPGRSGVEMREWSRQNVLIRETWIRLSIPKTWKNTKSGNKMKPYIKISRDDPFHNAMIEYISLCPKSVKTNSRNIYASNPLFLRPKKKYAVKYTLCGRNMLSDC